MSSSATWVDLAKEWKTSSGETKTEWEAYNFIGGQRLTGGEVLEVFAPATGKRIGVVPRSTSADVDKAVAAAEAALPSWRKSTPQQRSALLHRMADALEKRSEHLAALESIDQGKTCGTAGAVDIPRSVSNFRFFAGAILHGTDGFHRMPDAINYTTYAPVGIVGLITPWNLPLYLLTWKVAPALAAGNCIVAKPSELTPLTATVLAEVAEEAGVPPGVFNLVHGLGAECGQAMVAHSKIRAISFTGGTATGAKVAATAAPMFKKLSLELGGKNATIVFPDADFDKAVAGAVAAGFSNQGEICLCGSRLLVHRSIHDRFVAAFVDRVRHTMVPGDPRTSTMGALVSKDHRDKVESYIKIARSLGGKIECGGERPSGLGAPWDQGAFLLPTVITGLPWDSVPAVEEIFGPVVTVHPFDTVQEAVDIANCTRYGLAGSVWTRDLDKAHAVAEAVTTGMIWVNCWLHRDLRVPFGGVKDSGVGREGGRLSLDFFSESKNVCVKLNDDLSSL